MTRRGRLTAFAGVVLASTLAAQTSIHELRESRRGSGPAVVVEIEETCGSQGFGGMGWVDVRLRNETDNAHDVDLAVGSRWRNGNYEATWSVRLEPGENADVVLPVVVASSRHYVRGALGASGSRLYHDFETGGKSREASVLVISERGEAAEEWGRALSEISLPFDPVGRRPSSVPTDWRLVSGFDHVIVDGRSRGFDADLQLALVDYVRAGGAVTIGFSDNLPDGALRERLVDPAVEEYGARDGSSAFGRWISFDASRTAQLLVPGARNPDLLRRWRAWLNAPDGGGPGASTADRAVSGPMPAAMYAPDSIPGLGGVPVRTFFGILFLFAILVGPVNYVYWRRRRRLSGLLLTVPAAGFAVTFVVLVWGMLAEGLDVKGTLRTVTVLDQTRHEAVTWDSRTLYAGLSPGALRPSDRTYVSSIHLLDSSWRRSDPVRMTRDLTRSDGVVNGLLPSRYASTLSATTLRTDRARLRFRRRDDGRLDVLAGPELQPLVGEPSLVYRDHDGRYHVGDGGAGGLQRVDAAEGERAVRELFEAWAAIEERQARHVVGFGRFLRGSDDVRKTFAKHGYASPFQRSRVVPDELARGNYVVRARHSESFDDFGIVVEWLRENHLVFGKTSREDVVD